MPREAPDRIELPDPAWQSPAVLAACRSRDANVLLRLARKYGVTNERLSYWTGIDPGEISKRLAGRYESPVRTIDRWERIADGLSMPAHARQLIGLAAPADLVPVQPLALSEPYVSERDLAMAADESARFGEWAEAANAGRFSVDQLADELRILSTRYLTGSPVPVFVGARTVRDRAAELLKAHSAPGRASDLYAIAGYACTLLAWISGDLGQLRAADTHGRTAWLCADLADSTELRAWVLSTRSKTAFWDRRLDDAAALAGEGRRWAGSTSVGVLLASQEADAAAEMGRHEDAHRFLGIATGLRDNAETPDTIGGLLSCGPARQSNYAAGVFIRTGRPDDALGEVRDALVAYQHGEPRSHGTEMQLYLTRALAYVDRGSLDGAADALATVLATPAEQRLATVSDRLGVVTAALAGSRFAGSREADSIQQAITDFRSETAALPLPYAIEEGPG